MFRNISYKDTVLGAFTVHRHYLAFTRILESYNDCVCIIEFKFTHITTVAKEIFQYVFLKKWLRRERLIKIENCRDFLFIITRKYICKAIKLNAKNYELSLITYHAELPVDNDSAILESEKEYNSLLQKAVDYLIKNQKRLYHFIKENGFKREKAAGLLHQSRKTVILFITGHEKYPQRLPIRG
ncbi:MAG: hypothetical protein ABI288_11185 [Ginsengibacter sp.]